MMGTKNIGILGCGWLGQPLATHLINAGHAIKGSTTHIKKLEGLRQLDIDPYVIELHDTFIDGGVNSFLSGIEILVVNIPPGLRAQPHSDYPSRMSLLVRNVNAHASIKHLIYVSSTAVFHEDQSLPVYDEKTPANASDLKGKKLLAGEHIIQTAHANTTIIRPGGLIGGDRHPVKYLAGKKNVSNPEAPVNLTNRDFLIQLIMQVIDGDLPYPIIHAISEPHDTRQSYYIKKAQEFNLEPPVFNELPSVGKKITSVWV